MNLVNSKIKLERIQNCQIAIEIDFPNIYIGVKRSDWPLSFDYQTIENFALEHGVIHSSRIYADWNDYLSEKAYLSQFDTELIHIEHINVRGEINKRKDLVDTLMAYNIGKIAFEFPAVDLVILVSGDADFLPVVRSLRERENRKIIVIAAEKSLSEYIGKYANYCLNYEYISKLY